jgi:hypothetical protein
MSYFQKKFSAKGAILKKLSAKGAILKIYKLGAGAEVRLYQRCDALPLP